jgi:hypothetical protein
MIIDMMMMMMMMMIRMMRMIVMMMMMMKMRMMIKVDETIVLEKCELQIQTIKPRSVQCSSVFNPLKNHNK